MKGNGLWIALGIGAVAVVGLALYATRTPDPVVLPGGVASVPVPAGASSQVADATSWVNLGLGAVGALSGLFGD